MSNASPEARREEMLRFISCYPDAGTSMVVDHMMEKFEGTARHQHRAMLQRVDKEAKRIQNENMRDSMGYGDERDQTELSTRCFTGSGRTSSKSENPSRAPKAGKPATNAKSEGIDPSAMLPKASKPRKKKRKSGSALPDGRSAPVRVATEWPDIPRNLTKKRRAFVRDMLVMNPEMPDRALLKEVKHAYPAVDEGATRAIVFQVRYALGKLAKRQERISAEDAKKHINARLEKVAAAKCPACGIEAWGEDEIQAKFGFRSEFQRRQSNCRTCRKTKLRTPSEGS